VPVLLPKKERHVNVTNARSTHFLQDRPMRVMRYRHLDTAPVQAAYDRFRSAVESGDLAAAKIKKMKPTGYYRARLDDTNRLLLEFKLYEGKVVCLVLEVILQHRYERSRFLRGAGVQEEHIEAAPDLLPDDRVEAPAVQYLHPTEPTFHLLGQVLSFDDEQLGALTAPLPLMLMGGAGSGKTALLLERLREEPRPARYVTRSEPLVRHARSLLEAEQDRSGPRGSRSPETPDLEEVTCVSLHELLAATGPLGAQELTYPAFVDWFTRHPLLTRFTRPRLLHEEFTGVLGAHEDGPLTWEQYAALGVRQSLYPEEERPHAYQAFCAYRAWLQGPAAGRYYDPNLEASARSAAGRWPARQQTLAIDEVQDLSPAVLKFILGGLDSHRVLVAGDAHQLVYPGSFTWGTVRRMLPPGTESSIHVLHTNFRNAAAVRALAQRTLRLKHRRFGSVEREHPTLARPDAAADLTSPEALSRMTGQVTLVAHSSAGVQALRTAVQGNSRAAVLVLREEDRAAASDLFGTPLVFSLETAKGLEYDHVVLYRLIAAAGPEFVEIAGTVTVQDLEDEVTRGRARDKRDKTLHTHGPLLNSVYVGLTRARQTLTLIEDQPDHPLLNLLIPPETQWRTDAPPLMISAPSSRGDWERQAVLLRLQGHAEQADDIHARGLGYLPVPWDTMTPGKMAALIEQAANRKAGLNSKPLRYLSAWVLNTYQTWLCEMLASVRGDQDARKMMAGNYTTHRMINLTTPWQNLYGGGLNPAVLTHTAQYGPNHLTERGDPVLMTAADAGNVELVKHLITAGADPGRPGMFGSTPHMTLLVQPPKRLNSEQVRTLKDLLAPAGVRYRLHGTEHHLPTDSLSGVVLNIILSQLNLLSSFDDTQIEQAAGFYFFPQNGIFAGRMRDVLHQPGNEAHRPVHRAGEPEQPWGTSAAHLEQFEQWLLQQANAEAGGHGLWEVAGQDGPRGSRPVFMPHRDLELQQVTTDAAGLKHERWVTLGERFASPLIDLPHTHRPPALPPVFAGDQRPAPLGPPALHESPGPGIRSVSRHPDAAQAERRFRAQFAQFRTGLPMADQARLLEEDANMLWHLIDAEALVMITDVNEYHVNARSGWSGALRQLRRLVRHRLVLIAHNGTLVPFFSCGEEVYVSRAWDDAVPENLRAVARWQQGERLNPEDWSPETQEFLLSFTLGAAFGWSERQSGEAERALSTRPPVPVAPDEQGDTGTEAVLTPAPDAAPDGTKTEPTSPEPARPEATRPEPVSLETSVEAVPAPTDLPSPAPSSPKAPKGAFMATLSNALKQTKKERHVLKSVMAQPQDHAGRAPVHAILTPPLLEDRRPFPLSRLSTVVAPDENGPEDQDAEQDDAPLTASDLITEDPLPDLAPAGEATPDACAAPTSTEDPRLHADGAARLPGAAPFSRLPVLALDRFVAALGTLEAVITGDEATFHAAVQQAGAQAVFSQDQEQPRRCFAFVPGLQFTWDPPQGDVTRQTCPERGANPGESGHSDPTPVDWTQAAARAGVTVVRVHHLKRAAGLPAITLTGGLEGFFSGVVRLGFPPVVQVPQDGPATLRACLPGLVLCWTNAH